MLTVCQGMARGQALTDLLGWEWFDARRRLTMAVQICPRVGLDATVLPPRLSATAEVFAAGGCSLRQVEVVARVLSSGAAGRLSPEVWAAAEAQIATKAGDYSPADLHVWGTALVETLDQDGAEPDERPPAQVNELFLTRTPTGPAGTSPRRAPPPARALTPARAGRRCGSVVGEPMPSRRADAEQVAMLGRAAAVEHLAVGAPLDVAAAPEGGRVTRCPALSR